MKDYVGEAYTRQKRLQLCPGPYAPFSAEVNLLLSAVTIAICPDLETTDLSALLFLAQIFPNPLQVLICLYLVTEAGKLLNLLEATWQTLVEMAGEAIVRPQSHFILFCLWTPLHFQFCGSVWSAIPTSNIDRFRC